MLHGGTVSYEDRTSYRDNGTRITLTLETGWINFDTILGYRRLYRILVLGQNISSHLLQMKIGFDYDTEWTDTLSLSSPITPAFDITDYYA
jgi:hypothetical protein